MELKNLKDFEKLVKLCRRLGIEAMEVGTVKFNLGAPPRKEAKRSMPELDIPEASLKIPQFTPSSSVTTENDSIKTTDLSDEDLLFYSTTDNSQGQQ